jgi:hypothetical protein
VRSFELSQDRWWELQEKLRGLLEDIEERRGEFSGVEGLLHRSVRALQALDIDTFPGPGNLERNRNYSIVPQGEALAFARSHKGEASESGYRDVIRRIESEYQTMRLSGDLLQEFHKTVRGAKDPEAGKWKRKNNYVPIYRGDYNWFASRLTTFAEFVPKYVDATHSRFSSFSEAGSIHPLLLAAAYSLDILYIHPFSDGNGRVVRLAIMLLLYQYGYSIGKYLSLETAANRKRAAYTESLLASMTGWEDVRHDLYPWSAFLLGLIRDGYIDVSRRTDELARLADDAAALLSAIKTMPRVFGTADLISKCPGVAQTTRRILLNRMRESGRLLASLSGREVVWEKL